MKPSKISFIYIAQNYTSQMCLKGFYNLFYGSLTKEIGFTWTVVEAKITEI